MMNELERFAQWREEFSMKDEGAHTFQVLEKMREIEQIVWGPKDSADKIIDISKVLSQ